MKNILSYKNLATFICSFAIMFCGKQIGIKNIDFWVITICFAIILYICFELDWRNTNGK